MADKFVTIAAGVRKLREFITTSAGALDSGKAIALNASGQVDATMLPSNISNDRTMTASETLAAADIVNAWDDSGTVKVRKADATATGKKGVGFVQSGITAAATGTVSFEGTITGLSGLTEGADYFLSTTAGAITATAPSASGNVVQFIGVALSATELLFVPDTHPIVIE